MTEHRTDRQLTEEEAGELRQRLRGAGWSADVGWAAVGSGTAAFVEAETRRTLAYLASVRAVDGGAAKVWKEGDVPAPVQADAREVLVARIDDTEWQSDVMEAPAEKVAELDGPSEDSAPASAQEAV